MPPVAICILRASAASDGNLVHAMSSDGEVERLAAMDVTGGLAYLWPRLAELAKALPA